MICDPDLFTLYVWCLDRVCRPRCRFVSNKSSRVRDTSPRPRGCKNYPELPCELTEKLTGTAVRALFLQIGLDSHTTDTTPIFHILYTRGVLLMPPRRGQNPAGAITEILRAL